jgi:hypothetical protein
LKGEVEEANRIVSWCQKYNVGFVCFFKEIKK